MAAEGRAARNLLRPVPEDGRRAGPGTDAGARRRVGQLQGIRPEVTATDILTAPWLDLVADAQNLPFADASFANIALFDVLHHIEFPRRFLAEASRVLKPGGRIVMVEPAITPVSWPFYRIMHPEPVDISADPLDDGVPESGARCLRRQPGNTVLAGGTSPRAPCCSFSRAAFQAAALAQSVRLSIVRRLPTLEPDSTRVSETSAGDGGRAGTRAGTSHGFPPADGGGEAVTPVTPASPPRLPLSTCDTQDARDVTLTSPLQAWSGSTGVVGARIA